MERRQVQLLRVFALTLAAASGSADAADLLGFYVGGAVGQSTVRFN